MNLLLHLEYCPPAPQLLLQWIRPPACRVFKASPDLLLPEKPKTPRQTMCTKIDFHCHCCGSVYVAAVCVCENLVLLLVFGVAMEKNGRPASSSLSSLLQSSGQQKSLLLSPSLHMCWKTMPILQPETDRYRSLGPKEKEGKNPTPPPQCAKRTVNIYCPGIFPHADIKCSQSSGCYCRGYPNASACVVCYVCAEA